MQKLNKNGFTLIELLVIISIIGFLATASMVAFNNVRKKARDAQAAADVKQIITAFNLAADNAADNKYPSSDGTWRCLKNSGTCWRGTYSGDSDITTAIFPFIKQIPGPPHGGDSASCFITDAYLYSSNRPAYTGSAWDGPVSAYIIYTKESGPFTAAECSTPSYNSGSIDCGLYYCYKFIGYN